jgi:cyanate permease
MSLGLAPLFMGTFPVFLPPISKELGWGAAVYPQSALMAGTASAVAGPLVGAALDRFGVRAVLLTGLIGWAAALFTLSELGGSQAQLLTIAALLGITACTCGPVALAKVIAGWFDRHRGLALGIVLSAAPAVATAISVVVADRLIAHYGWRVTYRTLAATVIAVALPIAFFWLREAPSNSGARQAGPTRAESRATTGLQALRTRDFWMIMLLTALVCTVANAVVSHFVAFAAERGVSSTVATLALSAYSLVAPLGPLLAGALADRSNTPRPLAVFYSLPFIGFAMLILLGPRAVMPAMVLLGVGFSAASGMLPYLLTRYFGVGHAAQLFGIGLGVVTLSMGLGPVILGVVHDQLKSFTPATPVLLLQLLGAIAVSLTLRSYARPEVAP